MIHFEVIKVSYALNINNNSDKNNIEVGILTYYKYIDNSYYIQNKYKKVKLLKLLN